MCTESAAITHVDLSLSTILCIFVRMDPSLKLNISHQLRIAQKISKFVEINFPGSQNIADVRKGTILMALADKSFVTFRAIRHLLQDSLFVDDASALVRVQYECIVNALFVFYSPYPVPDNYADYFMYRNWHDYMQVASRDAKIAANALSTDDLDRMKADYNRTKSQYSVLNGNWTHKSLRDRAVFVDSKMPEGFKTFALLYELVYRPCSAWVHSDVRSIQSRVRQLADGTSHIHREVTSEEKANLMYAANSLALAISFPIAAEFYGNKVTQLWNTIVREWSGLSAEEFSEKTPPSS